MILNKLLSNNYFKNSVIFQGKICIQKPVNRLKFTKIIVDKH